MSVQRHLKQRISMLLFVSILLCSVSSVIVACFLIDKNMSAIHNRQLDNALEEVQNIFHSAGDILRDIACDSSLHLQYESVDKNDNAAKYSDSLNKLRNHLLYILLTQNNFRCLVMESDGLVVGHFGSRVATTTSLLNTHPLREDITQTMRLLSRDVTISRQCVFSVYTDAGFTLSGLVDLEGILGDVLYDYVIYDNEGRLLYNGLIDRHSDSVISALVNSGDDTVSLGGETMHVARKTSGSITAALFYKSDVSAYFRNNIPIFLLVNLSVLILCAITLHSSDAHITRMLNSVWGALNVQGSLPELAQISAKLRVGRRAHSLQTKMWLYLVRICALPMIILLLSNAWTCICSLQVHNKRYTAECVQQQITFTDLHYKRCEAFLRNATLDYLLQEHMSGGESDPSFFREYSAVLWNKCSERKSLKSVAIFDESWDRVYLTGSTDVSANDATIEHFTKIFNSLFVIQNEDSVSYTLGIRDACFNDTNLSGLFNLYGYMTVVLVDPVTWMNDLFNDSRIMVSIVDPDAPAAAIPSGFIRVNSSLPSLGIQIEVVTPISSELRAGVSINILVFAVMLTGLFSALVLIASHLSRWMFNALIQMQDSLECIYQGNESGVQLTGVQEIDFVIDCFRDMTVLLQEKTEELNRKQIELLNEQKQRVDLQLAAIESQLSPHFLFNTFTSIRFLLEEDNASDAKQMLKLTARMFRSIIYRGSTLTSLEAEMEHVRSYTDIQRFRFKEQLELYIEPFPPEILDALLPQYTLQPLVENALEHGLPGTGCLSLRICAAYSNGLIRIDISDNGGSLDSAALEHIEDLLENDDPQTHCGLSNVNKRLKLHFGAQYGLSFAQNEFHGMTVTVCIPRRCSPSDFE